MFPKRGFGRFNYIKSVLGTNWVAYLVSLSHTHTCAHAQILLSLSLL